MSDDLRTKPRLLLVEDDPISRGFMQAALEGMPAEVEAVDSVAQALALPTRHDLWLLDVNLPDGSGITLLAQLRARSSTTPALAHTADDSPALHAELRIAGFTDILVKPLTAASLRQRVARSLMDSGGATPCAAPRQDSGRAPLWDEQAALAALNGNEAHAATLRTMFLGELPRQHQAILAHLASGDAPGATRELHQLKASSGFVGALRMNAAASTLDRAMDDPEALLAFKQAVRETLSSG